MNFCFIQIPHRILLQFFTEFSQSSRFFHNISFVFPTKLSWNSHEVPLEVSQRFHGTPVAFPTTFDGTSHEILLESLTEFFTEFCWTCRGIFRRNSVEAFPKGISLKFICGILSGFQMDFHQNYRNWLYLHFQRISPQIFIVNLLIILVKILSSQQREFPQNSSGNSLQNSSGNSL